MRFFISGVFFVLLLFVHGFSKAQQVELWGVTYGGGAHGGGTIFSVDTLGNNHEVKFSFCGSNGSKPKGVLTLLNDGKVYGVSSAGGSNGWGTIYEYNPETNTKLDHFDFNGSVAHGKYPKGGLVLADNGKLYGTTTQGGLNDDGIIFEFDPLTHVFTKLFDFDGPVSGSSSMGRMIQADNGYLYGLTGAGGVNDVGVIFKFEPGLATYTKLFDFNTLIDGSGHSPQQGLTEAPNGKLYGVTTAGGTGLGVLFEFDPLTEIFTKKLNFIGSNGNTPACDFMFSSSGTMYGTTRGGGVNNDGILFKYNYDTNILQKLADFDSDITGGVPSGNLVEHSNGLIYGFAGNGGYMNNGTLFEFNPNTNIITALVLFQDTLGYNGDYAMIKMPSGLLLGVCKDGGQIALGPGVLFEFDPNSNTYNKKLKFGPLNGLTPSGTLTQHSNGLLYGTAENGADNLDGAIFSYDPELNIFDAIAAFDQTINGRWPQGSLTDGGNGLFYGMTEAGGIFDKGVLFEFNPLTETIEAKIHFDGLNGFHPLGGVILASNNKLYGTTLYGGTNDKGVIFEYDALTDIYQVIHNFDFFDACYWPSGTLIQADDGLLYGCGDNGSQGCIYSFDILSGTITVLANFTYATTGSGPRSRLIQAANGKLYGTTLQGGSNGDGTIFQFDISTGILTNELSFFDNTTGFEPVGGLLEYSPGKVFAMTELSDGFMVEHDYNTNTTIVKIDFDGLNGDTPKKENGLTPIQLCTPAYSSIESYILCYGDDFTFPDGFVQTNITTAMNHSSQLFSVSSCDSIIHTYIEIVNLDNSILQSDITLTSLASGAIFKWLNCDSSFAEIPGQTSASFTATIPGNYAVTYSKNGCIDTSGCMPITNQDFYNLPGYTNLVGEVFAFPVTSLDTCDAVAMAFPFGGIPPYTYDWLTQPNNENSFLLDSACEGFHSIKLTDYIGDSVLIDYYITDSSYFDFWYDTTFTGFVDTIYLEAPNCLLDFSVPLDSAQISQFYYIAPDTIPPGDLYFIEITYYQSGISYVYQDTVAINDVGNCLIYFSVYCPSKSSNGIQTFLIDFNFPAILSVKESKCETLFTLYPNPASDYFIIRVNSEIYPMELIIQDFSGKVVYQNFWEQEPSVYLDLNFLASGTYVATVKTEELSGSLLFVKQ